MRSAAQQMTKKRFDPIAPWYHQENCLSGETMTATTFTRRITVLAVLIVISLAVQAPGHFGLMDDTSTLAESPSEEAAAVAENAAGICPANGIYATAQVAVLEATGSEALPSAALDGSLVMAASDIQEENAHQTIGLHNAGQGVRIASLAGNNTPQQHAFSNASDSMAFGGLQESGHSQSAGAQSAGSGASSSAPSARNPQQQQQQHAALDKQDSNTIANAQQDKQANPAIAGNEAGRGVQLANLAPNPFLNGTNGSGNGGIDGSKGGTKGSSTIDPGTQGKNPGQGTGASPAIAVVAEAKTGENGGLAPFIDGSSPPDMKDLIIPPDWAMKPTAEGKDAGTIAPASCQSTGTCAAPVHAASTAVPEPGSLALVGVGMLGLWLGRRRHGAARAR